MSLDQSSPVPLSSERSYPPIGWLSTGALAMVIIGGILMASYAPRKSPLGAAAALLVAGALLLLSAGVLLVSLKDF